MRIGLNFVPFGHSEFLFCFASNLLDTVHPLSVITFTKILIAGGVSKENSFMEINKIMDAFLVLALSDMYKPFIVETDTSDFTVGAVLL